MTICTCKRQTSFLSPWINDLNVFMQGSFHIIEPPVWLWTWLWPLRLQPRPTTTTTHEWPTVTHLPDWVWNWYRSERPAYCWRLLQRLPWSSDRLSRLSITGKNLTFLHDPLPGSLRHSKQDQATRPEAHLEVSREDSVESRRTTATPNSSSFPHAIPEDVQFFEPSLVKLIMSHFKRIIIYKLIRRFHLLQCHMWATKMNTTLGFFFSQVVFRLEICQIILHDRIFRPTILHSKNTYVAIIFANNKAVYSQYKLVWSFFCWNWNEYANIQ